MAVASNHMAIHPGRDEFNQQEQMSCTELCTLAYLSRHWRGQDLIWGYNHDGNRWDFHENQWTSVVIAML